MTAALTERAPAPGGATPPTSLPAWLLRQATERPKAVAMRVKELGRWREITWAQHLERVAMIGHALRELGVSSGDRVAIVSEGRPEWVAVDLAVQGIGATTVGLLTSLPEAELQPLLRRSGARLVVVEDEEQHDKVMAVRSATSVERVVIIDTRGFRQIEEPAMSLEALEAIGHPDARSGRPDETDAWRDHVERLEPGSTATIVFSAGTTGEPKGVMLANAALVAAAEAAVQALDVRAGDDMYSYLPLAEITERLLSVAVATVAATTVHFGEGGESFANDLREVQPTVLLGPPRVWERIVATVDGAVRRAGWLKRALCRVARRQGRRTTEARRRAQSRRSPGFVLADVLVSRPLRRRLGLARLRVALSGTAPAVPGVLDEVWSLGVPVRESYGVVESAGIAAVQPIGDVRSGTVGRAIPGVELRTGDDGVVMLRGASLCAGYLDGPGASSVLDTDGWYRTDDVGELDADGELRIVGRADDVLLTSTGNKVVPGPIEQRLAASPYIRDVVVIGDGRPRCTALIGVDVDALREWAAARDLTFNTHADLVAKPQIRELVADQVDAVNAQLAATEQITQFELLPVELSHDEGMLTATSKLRRRAVIDRFSELVNRMYGEEGAR